MKWLNPYTWLGALLIVALLIGGGWAAGHRGVAERDTTIEQQKMQLGVLLRERDDARAAVAIANRGLTQAAATFRRMSEQAKAEAAAAALAQAEAKLAAAETIKERARLEANIAALNRTLAAERAGCVDAQRPICGVPLE